MSRELAWGTMAGVAPPDERCIKWSATAGTLAPIWFWLTLTVLDLVYGTVDVSGHQLRSLGVLMYVGFLAYGALTLVMVRGLRRRMPPRKTSPPAMAALVLLGCGPLLATFTMGSEQGPPQSWHGWLHFAGFLLLSLMPILAMPLFGSAVWHDGNWRPLGPFSLAWGIVVAVVVFLPSTPADGYAIWAGPGSLAEIVLIGLWQIVVSRRLSRLARRAPSTPATGAGPTAENVDGGQESRTS